MLKKSWTLFILAAFLLVSSSLHGTITLACYCLRKTFFFPPQDFLKDKMKGLFHFPSYLFSFLSKLSLFSGCENFLREVNFSIVFWITTLLLYHSIPCCESFWVKIFMRKVCFWKKGSKFSCWYNSTLHNMICDINFQEYCFRL